MRSHTTGVTLRSAVVGAVGLVLSCAAAAEIVPIQTLTAPPVLDGNGDDWAGVPGTRVKLHKSKPDATTQTQSVLIKGGVYADTVFFYLEWQDSTEDVLHKPWVWDATKKKYVKGPQREDRLAIQFATGGDYTTDWLAGREFTAHLPDSGSTEWTVCEGRILLAEDNRVNQEVASGMLEPMGVEITVVEDGRAAVEAWSREHYDLLLMDCQMPDLDGYGATREIRRLESMNRQDPTPIIALTATRRLFKQPPTRSSRAAPMWGRWVFRPLARSWKPWGAPEPLKAWSSASPRWNCSSPRYRTPCPKPAERAPHEHTGPAWRIPGRIDHRR